jgi:hypothetical protein
MAHKLRAGKAPRQEAAFGQSIAVDLEWVIVILIFCLVWLFSRYLSWKDKGSDKKAKKDQPTFLSFLSSLAQFRPSTFSKITSGVGGANAVEELEMFHDGSGGQFAIAGARARMKVDESDPTAKYHVKDGIFEDGYLRHLISSVEATEFFGVNTPSEGNITGGIESVVLLNTTTKYVKHCPQTRRPIFPRHRGLLYYVQAHSHGTGQAAVSIP